MLCALSFDLPNATPLRENTKERVNNDVRQLVISLRKSSCPTWFAPSSFDSRCKRMTTRQSMWIILCLLSVAPMGKLHATEVRHFCDAPVFEPCPSFSARVDVRQHSTLFESEAFGYTRSEGAWTVHVEYEPVEECARVSLFVSIGPLDFNRIYEGTFINGGGTIDDSGEFMYKIGQLDSALRVVSASCFMPKGQSEFSSSPDPALSAFEQELARQRDELESEDESLAVLDKLLQRLARQEAEGLEGREVLTTRGETAAQINREDPSTVLLQYQREYQRMLENLQEQEQIADIERQQDNARELQMFLGLLGTGVQLYQLLDQDRDLPDSFPTPSELPRFTPLSSDANSQGEHHGGCHRGYHEGLPEFHCHSTQ